MSPTTSNESRPPMSSEAARVFAETAFYTALGMQREMGQRDFEISADARQYWLDRHEVTIPLKLQSGADWESDRPTVTERAIDLGRRAARYAIEDCSSPSEVVEIGLAHVKRATDEIIGLLRGFTTSYCMPKDQM